MIQPNSSGFRKRIRIQNDEQRIFVAQKVLAEAKQLQWFFCKVANGQIDLETPFNFKAIEALAEVLECEQKMLSLNVGNFIKEFPVVNHDQLLCLLTMRNDLVSTLKTMNYFNKKSFNPRRIFF